MVIPVEDWIKDTIWNEKHLTPTGWRSGTIRTEKGRYEMEVDRPPDCLMTIRSLEKMPSDPKERVVEWSEIRWLATDMLRIETAQEQWGVLPRRAPRLSQEAAAKHPELKNISLMQRPDRERPLGRRVKRW